MDEITLIPKWTTDKQFRDIAGMVIYRAESYFREGSKPGSNGAHLPSVAGYRICQ